MSPKASNSTHRRSRPHCTVTLLASMGCRLWSPIRCAAAQSHARAPLFCALRAFTPTSSASLAPLCLRSSLSSASLAAMQMASSPPLIRRSTRHSTASGWPGASWLLSTTGLARRSSLLAQRGKTRMTPPTTQALPLRRLPQPRGQSTLPQTRGRQSTRWATGSKCTGPTTRNGTPVWC